MLRSFAPPSPPTSEPALTAVWPHAATRWQRGTQTEDTSPAATPAATPVQLAAETPIALVFNGLSHAVMMATPQDLEAFALGFALSEGVIDAPEDCRDISIEVHTDATAQPSCAVHLEIAARHFARLKEQRRSLAGRTGCGLCGIDSLQALDLCPPALPPTPWCQELDVQHILRPFDTLASRQALNQRCSALHAAAWASPTGELLEVLEDVGRHNALDKLLGHLALAGRLAEPGFVAMTSRASYELVRKCARLGIPVLATVSAPTALAVQVAQQAQLQLWGLCRPPSALRYV
ncbi:MAG: formate dehydrogenase accessory sulfurtransferase FdhD [Acidovorax sp.]|nr:formate dehydrogenase accessory sulfurtransferase FdhD [Acidovorax sp.]